MARIGILGGSFNPPHKAHREMAKVALDSYKLDMLYFMPTSQSPFKSNNKIITDEHRMRMVRLLITGMKDDRCKLSDYEIKKGGINYTYETLEEFQKQHNGDSLFFIMGADSLKTFDKWVNPQIIVDHATILVAPRGNMDTDELKTLCDEKSEKYNGMFLPIDLSEKMRDVSSTEVRKEVADSKGEDDKPDALPRRIWRYILLHGLYGIPEFRYSFVPPEIDIKHCLKSTLKPKRVKHTFGVADTAEELGILYSAGDETLPIRCRLAGLLHDCAKYFTEAEQIELCDEYGIELTQTERENPSLIHGKLGAYLAQYRYGVKDEEIINAIRIHTVGRPGMTTLEKIIYISDYIEPNRVIPNAKHPLKQLRKTVKHDIDTTLILVIENTIDYLEKSKRVIDEASLATLEYYENL